MVRQFIELHLMIIGEEDLASEVHRKFTQITDKYSRVLLDQILFCMPFDAQESYLEGLEDITSFITEFYEGDPVALRRMLGFPSVSTTPSGSNDLLMH
jgi:hypothetical protein